MQQAVLVCGAGGFIGSHLVRRLREEGAWVRGVDLKTPEFDETVAHDFMVGDLRDQAVVNDVFDRRFDVVYQLAADMGGAGFIFTGDNDADIMHNSGLVNLNVLDACRRTGSAKVFYASSACVYPEHNQMDPNNPLCAEDSAYPANPDSEYGWEKLFSERMYLAYGRNHNIEVRIGRFHNIFGECGTWYGGREKAPAALCRKVAQARDGGEIEIWGDGEQTRSFLHVDECVEGVQRLVASNCSDPINIGSEEMISINGLAMMISDVAGKTLTLNHIPGPLGVRGRNSDNARIRERLDWEPSRPLRDGIERTYGWIAHQVARHA